MQREAALTRGEKNHVVKKLYLMAAQNPDDEYWQIDAPPEIKTIDSRTGFVRTMVDPAYKHLPHVVMVRIGGRDQAIVFNEHNKEAVRLAQAMKNLDIDDLHVVLGLAAKGRGPAGQSEQFYENVKHLNEIENEIRGRYRNGQDAGAYRESEPLSSLVPLANATENQVRKLRELRRNLTERKPEGYQERVREVDQRIGQAMERLNTEVSKTRRKEKQ